MEFWGKVVSYPIKEAKRMRTPDPDIMCNSRIKLSWLIMILIPRPPLSPTCPPTDGSNYSAYPTLSKIKSTSLPPSHKPNPNAYSLLLDTCINTIYYTLHNSYP